MFIWLADTKQAKTLLKHFINIYDTKARKYIQITQIVQSSLKIGEYTTLGLQKNWTNHCEEPSSPPSAWTSS
jgi:hypothetical protein